MWLVADTEYNALELDKVTNVWCLCATDLFTDISYEFGPDEIEQGIKLLNSAQRVIGHNILFADKPVLEKLYGWKYDNMILDTLILSRLAYPDRLRPFGYTGKAGPHSIECWGYRLGMQKPEHSEWDKYSPEMLVRCKEDVKIGVQVYKAIYKEMMG